MIRAFLAVSRRVFVFWGFVQLRDYGRQAATHSQDLPLLRCQHRPLQSTAFK